jgi:hypothetical protein
MIMKIIIMMTARAISTNTCICIYQSEQIIQTLESAYVREVDWNYNGVQTYQCARGVRV